jgi:hypothetical protein
MPQMAPRQQGMAQQPMPAPMQRESTPNNNEERILLIVPGLTRIKKLSTTTQYTLVATDRRLIFAQITNQMIKEETQQAKDQAKAEGKGFLGQVAAQWGSALAFQETVTRISDRFWSIPPEIIASGTKDNFTMPLNSMVGIEFTRKDNKKTYETDSGYQVDHNYYYEIMFRSTTEKVAMAAPDNPTIQRNLQQIYGTMVR